MSKKISLQGARKRAMRALYWIGENAFASFFIFLLGGVVLSAGVFYRYVYSLQNVDPRPVSETAFEEQKFEKILETWQDREARFEGASKEVQRNIFAPST